VGVRELRQNLSVYLDRVKRGAVLRVTEHGRTVAVLQPVPADAARLDRLAAQGLVTPPRKSLRDIAAPRPRPSGSPPTQKVLDDIRDDRL
jgi:prevent-host-death family protein